jgi:hypothetical protein
VAVQLTSLASYETLLDLCLQPVQFERFRQRIPELGGEAMPFR